MLQAGANPDAIRMEFAGADALSITPGGDLAIHAGGTEVVQKAPVILQDGTSVLFPNGWTDEDADKWRKGMELQRPSHHSVSARCFFH